MAVAGERGLVLITGGAGYIGSHAAYAFLEAGYQVVVVDDLSTGRRANLPADLPFHLGDVGDRALMAEVLARHRPVGVLHFAGSIVVPESVTNPGKYYRNNSGVSLNLFESCVAAGIDTILFSSTAAVYGTPAGGMAREDTPTRPINPYGWSKLMTEQMLADMAAAHGLRFAALRYFNVAGADPAGRSGQTGLQATHLIKTACEVAVGRRPRMSVFGTDYDTRDGTCIRDFIHVSDLAQAHLDVFRHLRATGASDVFNCGSGSGFSVREVIAALESVTGRPLAADPAPRRAGDPPMLVADTGHIARVVGWRPQRTLADIVANALDWEKSLAGAGR